MTEIENSLVLRHQAEEAASKLPAILVAADRVAATIMQGVHGRRRSGQGDTFWHFRQYQPGDPVQRIDWRQTARRRHAIIRENEWEIAHSVWLWLDRSASMNFTSDKTLPDKSWRSGVLTLALSALLVRAGERVALMGTGMSPMSNRPALERMGHILTLPPSGQTDLPPTIELPRQARVVFVSDFLSPIEEIAASVRTYASQGIKGHLLVINDPAEETLPFSGRVRFDGLEGEGSLLVSRVETVRSEYSTLMGHHRDAISDLARSVGWSCTMHATNKPPEAALLSLYHAISEPVDLRRYA